MSTQFTNRQWRLPNNENKDKQSNYSMDFDSVASSGIITSLETEIQGKTQLSFSLWFYSNSTAQCFLFDNETSNSNYRISLYYESATTTSLRLSNGSPQGIASFASPPINQWNHFVFTFDGSQSADSDKLKIYVNNSLQTITFSGTIPTQTPSTNIGPLVIGNGSWSTSPLPNYAFNGQIDAVSIYNYALSSSQITTLYGSSSTGIGNPMSLSPKPVAYYPLGDQDAFNGSNYLVPNSSLKDYVFNFSSDSIEVSATPSQLSLPSTTVSSGGFSISFWYYHNTIVNFDVVLQSTNANANNGFGVWQSTINNGLNFWVGHYLQGDLYTTNNYFTSQKWYNITCTFEGGATHTSKIFIDGVLNNSVSYTTSRNIHSGENILIGGWPLYSRFFDGKLSNVAILNTALPATGTESVESLYNYGTPPDISSYSGLQGWWKLDASATFDSSTNTWTIPDSSSNSNDGTSSGMTQANLVQSDLSFKTSYSPYALSFDGANDYIDLGNLTGVEANQFSISMWAKVTATNRILFNSGLVHPNGILIQYVGTYFFISVGGSGAASSAITLNTTKWYNILLSVNGTTLKLYIDGYQLGSDLAIGSGRTGIGSDAVLARYKYSTSHYVKGSISNLSIWNTALTSSQVTELYSEGIPQNLLNHSAVSSLVNWWQLGSNSSFNTNWTVLDEKGSNNGTSVNMTEDDIVDGVGSYANGTSSGMGGDEVIGDAPYSSSNSLSVNMDVLDRVEDTPS